MSRLIDDNNPTPRFILSQLGIQRDGTAYRSRACIDGQWVRFFHEWPEKIGGYEVIDIGNGQIVTSMFAVPKSESNDIYLGRPFKIGYFNLDNQGNASTEIDRTPTTGFTRAANNAWSYTLFVNLQDVDLVPTPTSYIVVQVSPNRTDVAGQNNGPVFAGLTKSNDPLDQLFDGVGTAPGAPILVSGGVVSVNNIVVAYGNNGYITWTAPGVLDSWSDVGSGGPRNFQFISHTKLVAAIEYFGSLLFWSLGSLIRATYNPPDLPTTKSSWSTQVLSNNISIISGLSVVQYNQLVFWIGNGQFYVFNGSVGRLQNYMSNNWFFDGINQEQKSKVFGWLNEQYDEIWFMYPRGPDAIENNSVVIYNVGRQVWYDATISRTCAIILNTFRNPLMASSEIVRSISPEMNTIINSYPIWRHEEGVDEIIGDETTAIKSYFEYSVFDLFTDHPSPQTNVLVETMRIEPDFVMQGDMSVTINNRMFAQGPVISTGPITFNGSTQFIDSVTSQGRQVSIRFESNVVGGYYEAGKILHDLIPGDVNV